MLDRLGRILSAEEWSEDFNPAQRNALAFLAHANEFSRAPSSVAEYLCTTRGTASQTLKALERKGFIEQVRSTEDKRSVRYDVTDRGTAILADAKSRDIVSHALSQKEIEALEQALETTTRSLLKRRGHKSFGVCNTCAYNGARDRKPYCTLLHISLTAQETGQLCHEHEFASASSDQR
ncbi:MAG: winged helix DNA-binding protein [Pseudomonadota bacterium]